MEKKKVSTIMCGDYNAGPRSGVYEFMRRGEFDCLKLSRSTISGQYHGTFSYKDKLSVQTLQRSCHTLDEAPIFSDY